MVSSSSAAFDGTIVNNTITTTINKKTSKGRQKIEIKKIEKKDSRQVTFSKRRTGLFKKAAELCVLTGAKVAILVNSPGGGKVYVFDEYDLIDRYLNDVVETSLGFPTNEFDQYYASSSKSEEELVDEMDIGQLEEYVCSLEEMKKDVVTKANGNIPALDLDEMKKDEVAEASDSVVIDNSEVVLDSNLQLDMSWLDSDLLDMSWLDSVSFDSLLDIGDTNTNDTFNLNFHGVEV